MRQAGPAFLLVGGLLAIGAVAEEDGVFAWLGGLAGRLPGHGMVLLCGLLAADAAVTATLNLDTAVLFLTPVMVHAARTRGLGEAPFLYGAVLMANASSTLLPGANLTNLIVLSGARVSGLTFLAAMLPATLGAMAVTGAVLLARFRGVLHDGRPASRPALTRPGLLGLAATAAAGVIVLATSAPAVPVAALGLVLLAVRRTRPAGLGQLAALFAAAVALGVLARQWSGPASLLAGAGRWETAVIGAVASVAMNNLPAAVLLTSQPPPQPRALMLGLAIGPNLAVTGSLSALLWLRVGRSLGAAPSIREYSRLGIVAAPLALAAAVALLAAGRPL